MKVLNIQNGNEIKRNYSTDQVEKLRPQLKIEYSLAKYSSLKLRRLLTENNYVNTFGALNGSQAVQMSKAGLETVYISGWQVAADGNSSGETYPDQSLYPCNSVPLLVSRINKSFQRADQVDKIANISAQSNIIPIVADAEAGFGGVVHAYELTRQLISAGAAAVHFEDQLASNKKCGHLGGKVLLPTSQFIKTLNAARLASDVMDVPTVIIARTDAKSAKFITSDICAEDKKYITGDRSSDGLYFYQGGIDAAIDRGLSFAPFADLLWFETDSPNIEEARKFAEAIHQKFPGKLLAYNCSPSFKWSSHLSDSEIASFQRDLGNLGYRFQFITLAGWHLNNFHTFNFAQAYKKSGMTAFVNLQNKEFEKTDKGYTAVKHQQEVGTGVFDEILTTASGGDSELGSLDGSTEEMQFCVTGS